MSNAEISPEVEAAVTGVMEGATAIGSKLQEAVRDLLGYPDSRSDSSAPETLDENGKVKQLDKKLDADSGAKNEIKNGSHSTGKRGMETWDE